ncbi:g9953 [Coccomyxa viridis]|uniref:peptidylprolyl isomerase n=1 Tax=Coccomyxa viridis TaxID=1274662 RepID=A0ABP1G452_9CHLO
MRSVQQNTERILVHPAQAQGAQSLLGRHLHRQVCHISRQRLKGRPRALQIEEAGFLAQQISGRKQHVLSRDVSTAATAIDALVHANVAGPGDYVLVHYCGTLDDDSVFDSSYEREALDFIVGSGKVIPGFDSVVIGMVKGERRKERVEAERAYGEWRSEMTARIPSEDLPKDVKLSVGDNVRLSNGTNAVVRESTAESVLLDFNHPMAGKALTFEVELLKLTKAYHLHKATFGGGCFWGPELLFQRVPGVVATEVGYAQGSVENPTYEDVCTGDTGHTEVVQVTYDPSLVTYEDLLKVFWRQIDPCTENGQGSDRGSQYRTGIYTHNGEQRHIAESSKRNLQVVTKMQDSEAPVPIRTEVEDLKNYHKAEEYHQQYLSKGGRFGNAQSPAKGCDEPIRCYG